jgi:hypothetical protein
MHSSWKSRGGGPWGFGQILFRGVLGVVRKSRMVPFSPFFMFYSIFMRKFFGPYHPPPSSPPLVHLCKTSTKGNFDKIKKHYLLVNKPFFKQNLGNTLHVRPKAVEFQFRRNSKTYPAIEKH